ncbi:MAG: hypothetical protein HY898_28070 [Deltaproteobacteria bacterium]|nr:hypothetical protein [Deltaproteobacteria bacterium]
MNPAQQQFLQQWQGWLQQVAGQVTQILQETDAGCRQLLASQPTDPMPMQNALQAVHIKVTELKGQVSNAWTQQVENIVGMGNPGEVMDSGQIANEGLEQWIDETWGRFRSQWRVETMKVFWNHVQQLMNQPVSCTQCGGSIMPNLRHVADTVTCKHCGGINQVSPHPDVYLFYTIGPDIWAEAATLDKRFEIDRFRSQVRAQLRANRASLSFSLNAGEDEPVESLLKWESMERDYWTHYYATKAQLLPAKAQEQAESVESSMRSVLDECKRSNAWRQAKGMENRVEIARTPGVIFSGPEYGPLRPDQVEEFFYQAFMLDDSRDDPSRFNELLKRFGYKSNEQFEHVRITFNRNVNSVDQAFLQMQVGARARATKDKLAEKAASSPLMAPVEGVTLEQYAHLCAQAASGISQQDFVSVLAQAGMDKAKFDRVAAGWTDRMKKDPDFVVTNEYSKFFAAAPPPPGAAPRLDPSTVSFEMFCEIMGAQTAWSTQGKDVNAMIKQVFNMTALDWSNVSSFWSPKMMTDMNLAMRMSDLMMRAQQKYMAM